MTFCYASGPAWHVVYTAPQAEKSVRNELVRAGLTTYLPVELSTKVRRRKRIDVESPLFSRYLFVRFDPWRDDWQRILEVDDVEDILRNCDVPSRVPAAWIEALQHAEGLGVFDRRKGAQAPFKLGEKVRITEGPLAGLQAVVDRFIDKVSSASPGRKVKVLMDFLGRMSATEVDLVALEKA